jgi:hypothetical protein
MVISHHQNVGQNYYLLIADKSFEILKNLSTWEQE